MAREVAVDVASHSPQVDPILDELADVLADLEPDAPTVPFYSATLYDPRDGRHGTPVTGRTTCVTPCGSPRPCRRRWRTGTGSSRSWRHTRCSPTPSSRPPAASTCRSPRWPALRRELALPHGLRGFRGGSSQRGRRGGLLGAVSRAAGWWTRPCRPGLTVELLLSRDGQDHQRTWRPHCSGASAAGAACAPAGGAGAPRVAGRGRHRGAAVARRPSDTQRGRPSGRRLLRDGAGRGAHGRSARRPRSATSASSRRCCSTTRPRYRCRRVGRGAGRRRLRGGDTTTRANTSGGPRGPARRADDDRARLRTISPRCSRRTRPAGRRRDAEVVRRASVFSSVRLSPVWPPRTPPKATVSTVLAEIGLPGPIRSQQSAYGVHPSAAGRVLPIRRRSPRRPERRRRRSCWCRRRARRLRAYGTTRNAHYCHTRVTRAGRGRSRGRPRRAGRAPDRAADRHGCDVAPASPIRIARSRAQRAAADHRMAAARSCPTWPTPTREHGC